MIDEILAANRPEDVFGELPVDFDQRVAQVNAEYRRLAREVHPDHNGDPRASDAFARLGRMVTAAKQGKPVVENVVIRTRRHAYRLTDLYGRGDTCDLYWSKYDSEDGEDSAIIKVVRDPKDSDLVVNEGKVLKRLLGDPATFDLASPYLPPYIEAFGYRPQRGRTRQALAMTYQPGFYTAEQIKHFYPGGINPKDAAWMMRRLFMALGFAAAKDTVHGAVLPPHVLLHPEHHGLKLIDWKASVEQGYEVPIVVPKWRSMYAPEILDKAPVTPATDIHMAVNLIEWLISPREIPSRLKAFFRGCRIGSAVMREQDPWVLMDEFTELIESAWGPRRFRPFPVPPTTTKEP